MPVLVNVAAFQIGWFACALGAAHGLPLAGAGVGLAIVAGHLAFATDPRAELKLVLAALAIGLVFDPALALAGLITFASGAFLGGTVAPWMLTLWMLFAITLNVSLRWLRDRPLPAVVLGGLGGPLAYLAGEKLGALQVESGLAIAAIAAGWAAALWLLAALARRFDGFTPAVVSQEA